MSLITAYRDTIITEMGAEHVRISEGGRYEVVTVQQEYGSEPQFLKVYTEDISKDFNQCDWLIFKQPPQSPVKNVKDACLLPMWKKAVSSDQTLIIVSKILSHKKLYQKLHKVFWDKSFIPAISHTYAGHHQISCAIFH